MAFYARASTEREKQASSLVNNISYCTDFSESNPLRTFVDGYIDDGIRNRHLKAR
ncbi:MAG: hypothetical protein LBU32_22865 [Clostridiales bacterium]|nr:hypothetical protein [Clostridiales bacterium]